MAYAALALSAYSAIKQGQASKQAANYNAAAQRQEQATSLAQGTQQEDQVLRNSRESLGRQLAAFGSAGVGYGGSSTAALRSSAINQELDALNTKYKGELAGYGYGAQAGIEQYEGQQQQRSSNLLAGATLLKGLGPYYTTAGGMS